MSAAAEVFALMLGYRYETVETYRRCMIARWLSGRFCDPQTVLVPPLPGDTKP